MPEVDSPDFTGRTTACVHVPTSGAPTDGIELIVTAVAAAPRRLFHEPARQDRDGRGRHVCSGRAHGRTDGPAPRAANGAGLRYAAPMRFWLYSAAVAVTLSAGAGCRGKADRKLDSLMPLLDEMCACRDKACGAGVAGEYQAWFQANVNDKSGALDSRQAERFDQIVGAMQACREKAGGPGSMLPETAP